MQECNHNLGGDESRAVCALGKPNYTLGDGAVHTGDNDIISLLNVMRSGRVLLMIDDEDNDVCWKFIWQQACQFF